jgi:hypothetical protein
VEERRCISKIDAVKWNAVVFNSFFSFFFHFQLV